MLDEGHHVGPPLVVVGEAEAAILGQRLHALADRPLGQAKPLEDIVHLAMQPGQRVDPQLVDFVGAHRGGGRGLQCPAIISLAAGTGPHAGIIRRPAALLLEHRQLAGEGRGDLLRRNGAGTDRPVAGDRLGPPLDRFDQPAAAARTGEAELHLLHRLVEQEGRGDRARGGGGGEALGLAVELHRKTVEPR